MRLTSAGVLPISSNIEHRFAHVKINIAAWGGHWGHGDRLRGKHHRPFGEVRAALVRGQR